MKKSEPIALMVKFRVTGLKVEDSTIEVPKTVEIEMSKDMFDVIGFDADELINYFNELVEEQIGSYPVSFKKVQAKFGSAVFNMTEVWNSIMNGIPFEYSNSTEEVYK